MARPWIQWIIDRFNQKKVIAWGIVKDVPLSSVPDEMKDAEIDRLLDLETDPEADVRWAKNDELMALQHLEAAVFQKNLIGDWIQDSMNEYRARLSYKKYLAKR